MKAETLLVVFVGPLALAGTANAFWRQSCSVVQTGRVDPIVSPGEASSHAHKLSGAANVGLSSTFETLRTAKCSSCEIQDDKSAYWTPQLYYEHSNGSFEEVTAPGMTVYYLRRGDNLNDLQPFPPGLRMLSGNALTRSYDSKTMTYLNTRPVADRVSFACLDSTNYPETPGMGHTQCSDGLRAQVHFQSCWNGKDLYKSDNTHVAYMSQIDNGKCPPGYPVHLLHLFYEVLYSVSTIEQDGGRFVFSNGDPTGFGFHGDFMNGWDQDVLTAGTKQCAVANQDGNVAECAPFKSSDISDFSSKCPVQPPLVKEDATGLIDKLPGCIKITDGPQAATPADINCPTVAQEMKIKARDDDVVNKIVTRTTPTNPNPVNGYAYVACYKEGSSGRALNSASYTDSKKMTVESCTNFCAARGYGFAGVEYAKECHCGRSISTAKTSESKCSMACVGNSKELCGGSSVLNVYQSG